MTTEFTKNIELIQKLKSAYIAAGGSHHSSYDKYLGSVAHFLRNAVEPEAKMHIEGLMKAAYTDGYLTASMNHPETVHPNDLAIAWAEFKSLFGNQPEEPDFCKCGMFHENCDCDGALSDEVKLEWKHDFNDAMKKLCVEIEEIKSLVLKDRVEITGTPVGEYKVEVKLGDEHLKAIDRQKALRQFMDRCTREGLVRVINSDMIEKLIDTHPAEDASGLFDEFQKTATAPGVRDPSRCSLHACGCADKCRHPKDCQGAEAPSEPAPVTIHAKVIRCPRLGTRKQWEDANTRFEGTSSVDCWKNFCQLCMDHGRYEFKLLVSDDTHVWWEFPGDAAIKGEVWSIQYRNYVLHRKTDERESFFLTRCFKHLREFRVEHGFNNMIQRNMESTHQFLGRVIGQTEVESELLEKEQNNYIVKDDHGNIVEVNLRNGLKLSGWGLDERYFIALATNTIQEFRTAHGVEQHKRGPFDDSDSGFLYGVVHSTNELLRRQVSNV